MKHPVMRRTYKRGQVEWALWRTFVSRKADAGPPPVFATRVKRLLEIDRSGDLFETEVPSPSLYSFAASAPDGTGFDVVFTAFDAFCLAIALDLLDAGFKQKEVVFLMRFLRADLEQRFPKILSNPPGGRQVIPPASRPDCPVYTDPRGFKRADCHVFLIVRKVEVTEIFSSPMPATKAPAFLQPLFCDGYDALRDLLAARMPLHFRKAMIVEIAQIAESLAALLPAAPEVQRGRR